MEGTPNLLLPEGSRLELIGVEEKWRLDVVDFDDDDDVVVVVVVVIYVVLVLDGRRNCSIGEYVFEAVEVNAVKLCEKQGRRSGHCRKAICACMTREN